MTDNLRSGPIAAAAAAAHAVYANLAPTVAALKVHWVSLVGEKAAAEIAIIRVLAPFVRANPDAPAEALYRQAFRERVVQFGSANGWATLSLHVRMAWATFRSTLLAIDAAAALERPAPAPARPPSRIPIADTVFEPVEERFAPASYMKPRPPPAKKKNTKRRSPRPPRR